MTKPPKFTPMMLKLVREMAPTGEVRRHPGGFWCCSAFSIAGSFGTSTVEALVKRNAAEYVEWQEGRNGRFPIRARLLNPVKTVLSFEGEELEMKRG